MQAPFRLIPLGAVLGSAALGLICLLVFDKRLFQLSLLMMKVDLFAFGGGFASIPLMLHDVVDVRHWMDQHVFMDGIALGQITPGPVVITATFVGYMFRGPLGAVDRYPEHLSSFIRDGDRHGALFRSAERVAAFPKSGRWDPLFICRFAGESRRCVWVSPFHGPSPMGSCPPPRSRRSCFGWISSGSLFQEQRCRFCFDDHIDLGLDSFARRMSLMRSVTLPRTS